MGQQQLLLLVLATVIVGLATVAGIQAFEQGQTRANQDALTQTAVKIASDIQAKAKEPSQFGGGDGSVQTGVTLSELGYDASASASSLSGTGNDTGVYKAADGECAVNTSVVGPSSGGSGASAPGSPVVVVSCASGQNHVAASVQGTEPEDIETAAVVLGS